jgi:hypothetical protein
MQVTIDPPIPQWPSPSARRPIWTGHQATLFHPGIVAKYAAAAAAAGPVPVSQVLVDQDVYDPLRLAVPCRDGDRLYVEHVHLAPQGDQASGAGSLPGPGAGVAVGMRPAVRVEQVSAGLAQWPERAAVRVDVPRLLEAFAEAQRESDTLGGQMAGVLERLLPGWYVPATPATTLLRGEDELLDALRHDVRNCVKHYNEAVGSVPAAGMARLSVEPDRVEVPLWELRWMKARRRVYVDVADSRPMLITADGEPIDPSATLAPRALLMTALLRRPGRCCLFIHGTGGGVYDRITERWWKGWRGEKLAPMAVATADLYLDFDAPTGGEAQRRRAVWRAHHLPHNLDRELGLDGELAAEKRRLLEHMDDDRDRIRRRAAFRRVHAINRELAERHRGVLVEARRAVERAEAGVANAAVAGRRDWSFLFYPEGALAELGAGVGLGVGGVGGGS